MSKNEFVLYESCFKCIVIYKRSDILDAAELFVLSSIVLKRVSIKQEVLYYAGCLNLVSKFS